MDATPSSIRPVATVVVCLALICLASCETLKAPGSTADWFARNNKSHEKEAQAYRNQWLTRKDGAAARWLLANQIHNGLTVEEVDLRMGDRGQKELNTQEFNRKVDGFRLGDVFYRYGPDRNGESYYLGFRDGSLVNFDAERFADHKTAWKND